MTRANIIFVHGTGVRLPAYRDNVQTARAHAIAAGIDAAFIECAWGDAYGSEFAGACLPGQPEERLLKRQSEDFRRWSWLYADPLSELEQLTIRDTSAKVPLLPPGTVPQWLRKWDEVRAYRPSLSMSGLLQRAGVDNALWTDAHFAVTDGNTLAKLAFERSAHELPEAVQALARALVAELYRKLVGRGVAGPSLTTRDAMVQRLTSDWQAAVLAPSDFFANMLKRASTALLRDYRSGLSAAIAPFIGDILLYQSRGAGIRQFVRETIAAVDGSVFVVAHSLGGIACVDMLAMADAPRVDGLITVGSQAALLYELDALTSLKSGEPLPPNFPAWLNIYDRNDMLSYVASPLFGAVHDLSVDSGQPFPDAHSAYFNNDAVWTAIRKFIEEP